MKQEFDYRIAQRAEEEKRAWSSAWQRAHYLEWEGGKPFSQLLPLQRPIWEVAMEIDSLCVLHPLSQMYANASWHYQWVKAPENTTGKKGGAVSRRASQSRKVRSHEVFEICPSN